MTAKEKELDAIYDNSFPRLKRGWKSLCKARRILGSKDFYFMVLKLQREDYKSVYSLKKNPKI